MPGSEPLSGHSGADGSLTGLCPIAAALLLVLIYPIPAWLVPVSLILPGFPAGAAGAEGSPPFGNKGFKVF